jgi:hypothetical protein
VARPAEKTRVTLPGGVAEARRGFLARQREGGEPRLLRGRRGPALSAAIFLALLVSALALPAVTRLGAAADKVTIFTHSDDVLVGLAEHVLSRWLYVDTIPRGRITHQQVTEEGGTRVLTVSGPSDMRTDEVAGKLAGLVESGKLRPAGDEDLARWMRGAARHNNIPVAQFELRGVSTERSFMVLAPLSLPDGMVGGAAVTFLVPEDVPAPEGYRGENNFLFFRDYRCVRLGRYPC